MTAMIFDACRTPRGAVSKKGGSLATVRPIDLVAGLLQALPDRTALDPASVEDLILGCVTQTKEQGTNLARIAVLHAGWPDHVPGLTLNRFCTSGLDACASGAARVSSGECDLLLAGGVESMSRVPMFADEGDWFSHPPVMQSSRFTPLGVSADLLAALEGYERGELEAFALASQQRAVTGRAQGVFARSLVPVQDAAGEVLLAEDEPPRAGMTADKLAALEPAFGKLAAKGFGAQALKAYPQVSEIPPVHTPGTSPAPADGAGLVLIGSAAAGQRQGLTPRARIVAQASAAADPVLMLTAAEEATRKVLSRADLTPEQLDRVEVNEAFAATALRFRRVFGLTTEQMNVHGGALALGHAMGATGAMLIAQLLDELAACDGRYGLVSIAGGGGVGTAMLIERVLA